MFEHFFNSDNQGTWVLLSLDSDLFDNLGSVINEGLQDFIDVVKSDISHKNCPYHQETCEISLNHFLLKDQNPISNIISLKEYYLAHKKN